MEKDTSGIYCIENLINNKKYIGQSIHVRKRMSQHKIALNSKVFNHTNSHLQNAWDKYGEENFKFYILELCPIEMLDEREEYWSEFYNVYNSDYGYALKTAGQGMGSYFCSEETIQKFKNRKPSFLNRKHTEESKKRMKDNHYDCSGTNNPNISEIIQYDLDGNLIKKFEYMQQASNELNIPYTCISGCCVGKNKTAGGFIWRYADDPLIDFNKKEYFFNKHSKGVLQYNNYGDLIEKYESITFAGEMTGISRDSIKNVCNNKAKSAGGFIWRHINNPLTNSEIELLHNNPMKIHVSKMKINQYNKNNEYIQTWESIGMAARQLGISQPHIYECIIGKRKSAGGYLWKRVENTENIKDESYLEDEI